MGLDDIVGTEDGILNESIKYAMLHGLVPLLGKNKRKEYERQIGEASIIPYVAIKGLYRLISNHPRSGIEALLAISNWSSKYYSEQKYGGDRYLIYTQKDDMIPFRPEEDTMYAYMLAQLAEVSNAIADTVTEARMRKITRGFMQMNELGAEAFHLYPTVMPRFLGHDRLTLRVVQELDKPYNCCPSLHIAYSLYMYNVCKEFINNSNVKESFRHTTKCMFNSVLYTKQHSMIDIAFGMLCAKTVFESNFSEFDDMRDEFRTLSEDNPSIGYGNISDIYEEIRQNNGNSISGRLGHYLIAHRHPKMDAGKALKKYFDTENNTAENIIF
ncbi:MAG: hypothetical protein AABY09_00045 [Nanoarchaeota archaeon]